ncbi:hypothetical protein EVB55_040 [Rhizobium phage RHph_Y68]|uniref:Uncharacterized protein n=1 Tax=Rhizobium phage RHph_Y68 TaxID=2509787 RepID=A0A7S5R4U0_9CAUD|nr:hypothetical protein PP934_gp040 [Rhizobium phage RHph_Y68]QIG67975.1 hypothetical protein EVB55_040 [Rhizobium phage RHph_Y68]
MALPGEMLKVTFPAKIYIASTMYEFSVELDYTFWEDGSYTTFQVRMLVPGWPESVFPLQFKESLLKDQNFKSQMTKHIQKVRHYELNGG